MSLDNLAPPVKQLRLRDLQRAQLENLVRSLDAENGRLRQQLAATKSRYQAVFGTLVAYLRRPRVKQWNLFGSVPLAEFDTIKAPLLLVEDSMSGWELKFVVDREQNEMRVTCEKQKQGTMGDATEASAIADPQKAIE